MGIRFSDLAIRTAFLFLFYEIMDEAMRDECFGLLPGLLFPHEHHVPEMERGHACLFFEQYAERTDAFESHFVTNLRYGLLLLQQFLRPEQPLAGEVLVRRFPVHAAE